MARKRATESHVDRVERKILFYRTFCGEDEAGRSIAFNPLTALKHIKKMPQNEARYMASRSGVLTTMWVDRLGQRPRVRAGNIRREGLPAVEKRGRLGPLNIPEDSGLAEQTHAVFFPENNIVGVEFNFYGPRASRVSGYMVEKYPQLDELRFELLLRKDVTEKLRRLQDIRLLELKVRSSMIDTVSEADETLGSAFRAARDAGNADSVEIVLKPRPRSGLTLGQNLLRFVRNFARRRSLHEEAEKFKVKGLDADVDGVEMIDVLSDELISRKQVVKQDSRSRAVEANSVYRAIEESYSDLKEDLLAAAGAF